MREVDRRQFLRAGVSGLALVAAGPVLSACDGAFVPSQRLRLAVLGDVRTSGLKPPPVFEQIADRVASFSPDAVLTLGDMVEASKDVAELHQQWHYFKEVADHIKAPAWYTPGNHDTVVSDQAIDVFREEFAGLPQNGPEGYKGAVYSIDAGPVHVVSVFSEDRREQHRINDPQLAWLEDDLARHESSMFKLVMTHDPLVVVGKSVDHAQDAFWQQRNKVWEVLNRHRAILLAGHEHYYWRTVVAGVQQWNIGTSGSVIDQREGAGGFYHFAVLDLRGRGLGGSVYDADGQLRDAWTVGAAGS